MYVESVSHMEGGAYASPVRRGQERTLDARGLCVRLGVRCCKRMVHSDPSLPVRHGGYILRASGREGWVCVVGRMRARG